jgi:hypothetical protein
MLLVLLIMGQDFVFMLQISDHQTHEAFSDGQVFDEGLHLGPRGGFQEVAERPACRQLERRRRRLRRGKLRSLKGRE